MKILVVCRHLPSPTWGAGTRNYYLLRALARAHAVTLLALVDAADSTAAESDHAHGSWRLTPDVRLVSLPSETRPRKRLGQARALLTGQSYQLLAAQWPAAQAALDDTLAQRSFDVVLFESAMLAGYRLPPGLPALIDQHNLEYELLWRSYIRERDPLRRGYNWLEYRRFKPHELRRCRGAALVVVTSERERVLLQRLLPDTTIRVVPNGVDLCAYRSSGPEAEVAGRVVFTAALDYYPNIQAALFFARHCWPRIRQAEPAATWQIVGRNPPAEVRRLARLPGISVTGSVAATQPYLAAGAVAVAPMLIGGGTRLKILDALAMRKAVVSTSLGCEGLDVVPDTHLLIADAPEALARAVVGLLRDSRRRATLGDAGRTLVEERYSWDSCGARLVQAVDELRLNGRPA
jgi:glycosyltransferase involved in cell wall biosynthesis